MENMAANKPGMPSSYTQTELRSIERFPDGSRAVVTFLGTGDSFGSGGRDQPCIHIAAHGGSQMLLECGTTALVSMRKYGFDPDGIDAIVVSRLHGDRFGGIPFFVIEAQLAAKREAPLVIAGPPGIEGRVDAAMEIFYPEFHPLKKSFVTEYVELEGDIPALAASFTVMPAVSVNADFSVSYAFRVLCGGAEVGYSGGCESCEGLLQTAEGTDLFICEPSSLGNMMKAGGLFNPLTTGIAGVLGRRIILTRIGQDNPDNIDLFDFETAYDGLQIIL